MHEQALEEFKALHQSVEDAFEVDIHSRKREREIVNARITFAHILFERGYNKSMIGRYLNKNHATIIHYCKNCEGYLRTDKLFAEKFKQTQKNYKKNFDPVYQMDRERLKKEVFSLRKELNVVNCERETLKNEREDALNDHSRMDKIFRVLEQRTKHGTEDWIERKLNTWFNGVYTTGYSEDIRLHYLERQEEN